MGGKKVEPIESGSSTSTSTSTYSNTDRETRSVPLPADWRPTKEHIERANHEHLNLTNEVEKFKAHAAEKGRRAKNWNGAFTRWLIQASEYKQERQQARATTRMDRATQTYLADAARYEAQEKEGAHLAISQ